MNISIFGLIDMRSFSSLWYWIGLAVMWSSASYWVLGIPFDLVRRAQRMGGQAQADLEAVARVNVNRLLAAGRAGGIWLPALGSFLLSGLAVLGFGYDLELAQALFLMGLPLTLVWLMSLSAAHRIANEGTTGTALHRRLSWHRIRTQVIGAVSIFLTAMWGTYHILSTSVLGG
ncbi:component of SufBCD complex [Pukyongiella litopenaei]|uniref:component of SufBCD complex n=1 Tax=Pukyongiella litopenaei TaxID=2605946 RepID=UPI001FCF0050|nr:component of SufBCD complex [Pukyongiella litopenaei]